MREHLKKLYKKLQTYIGKEARLVYQLKNFNTTNAIIHSATPKRGAEFSGANYIVADEYYVKL